MGGIVYKKGPYAQVCRNQSILPKYIREVQITWDATLQLFYFHKSKCEITNIWLVEVLCIIVNLVLKDFFLYFALIVCCKIRTFKYLNIKASRSWNLLSDRSNRSTWLKYLSTWVPESNRSGKYLDFSERSGRYLPSKIQVSTWVLPGFWVSGAPLC